MDPITISTPITQPIEDAALVLRQRCEDMRVTNEDEHREAAAVELEIARYEKAVTELFQEPKRAANAAHRAVCEAERVLRVPLQTARRILSQKSMMWERAQKAVAEKRAREEAERRHAEAVAREVERAERLHEQGAPKTAEAVLQKAEALPVVPVAPEPLGKIAGLGSRENWGAVIDDFPAFVQYVARIGTQDPDFYELLLPNQKVLNMLARDSKDKLAIPGVRAEAELIRTRRV